MYLTCLIPQLVPSSLQPSHDSKGQRLWVSVAVVVISVLSVFFSLQDSLRGRPREIPHNEKLLSLKYEVKTADSPTIILIIETLDYIGQYCF